jgi:hypothetical protein
LFKAMCLIFWDYFLQFDYGLFWFGSIAHSCTIAHCAFMHSFFAIWFCALLGSMIILFC